MSRIAVRLVTGVAMWATLCSGHFSTSAAGRQDVPLLAANTAALLRDINPGVASSTPGELAAVGGRLFFAADDGSWGREPWTSDGTAVGTRLLADLASSGGSDPFDFTGVGETAFFGASWDARGFASDELWRSDGTLSGTASVGTEHPRDLTSAQEELYFWSYSDDDQPLLKADASTGEPAVVKSGLLPRDLTVVRGQLFFTDGQNPLWISDGTLAGTVKVRGWPDFSIPEEGGGSTTLHHLTAVRGQVFFTVNSDNRYGDELWKSDGTHSGTVLVKDVRSGPRSAGPEWLTAMRGTLFFAAHDGVHGAELWKSDGTRAGTALVKDIRPGPTASWPQHLTACDGRLYFAAGDGRHGRELWTSDSTSGGTRLVGDIAAGTERSRPAGITCVRSGVAFAAADTAHGRELWTTDGTAHGTTLHDINPAGASSPRGLVTTGPTLFMSADDGIHGRELWALAQQ